MYSEEGIEQRVGRLSSDDRNRKKAPVFQHPDRIVTESGTSKGTYEERAGDMLEKDRQDRPREERMRDISMDEDEMVSLVDKTQRFTFPAVAGTAVDALEEVRQDRSGENGTLTKIGELDGLTKRTQSFMFPVTMLTSVEKGDKEEHDKANEAETYGRSKVEDALYER
ncbi:hypothetical protein QQ045_029429 [Rhodiola kirilowii]